MMFSIGRLLDVKKENSALLRRIYFIFFVFGMLSTVLGAILPSLGDEYGLSQTVRGSLLSAHQLGNLVAVYAAGVLPYAIGRKLNTVLMGSLAAIGLIVITTSCNPLILIFAFILTGIGRGTMSTITNVVVGENAGNKAAGLNLLHAVFATGAFLSPFMVIAFMGIGWRAEPLFIMAVMIVALVLVATSKLSAERSHRVKGESSIPSTFTFWINTFIMFFGVLHPHAVTSLDHDACRPSCMCHHSEQGEQEQADPPSRIMSPSLLRAPHISGSSCSQGHRCARIRSFNERHLSDDTLDDGQILQQLDISYGHLHRNSIDRSYNHASDHRSYSGRGECHGRFLHHRSPCGHHGDPHDDEGPEKIRQSSQYRTHVT